MVSVTVPTWFSFNSTALAAFSATPLATIVGLVVKMSSPTSCTESPSRRVRSVQPAQSSSPMPSSMLMMG